MVVWLYCFMASLFCRAGVLYGFMAILLHGFMVLPCWCFMVLLFHSSTVSLFCRAGVFLGRIVTSF